MSPGPPLPNNWCPGPYDTTNRPLTRQNQTLNGATDPPTLRNLPPENFSKLGEALDVGGGPSGGGNNAGGKKGGSWWGRGLVEVILS